MAGPDREILERKIGALNRFRRDLLAIALYGAFAPWALDGLGTPGPEPAT